MAEIWTDLPYLLALARSGTLSGAAKGLAVDRTTVARRIEHLETQLSERLFERIDGRHVLTSFGRKAVAAAERAEQELGLLASAPAAATIASRRVKVSLSEHLLMALTPGFETFAATHSDIWLDLTGTDRLVDLSHFEADIVLRLSRRPPYGLAVRKVGAPVFALYQRAGVDHRPARYIARPGEVEVPPEVRRVASEAVPILSVDGIVSMREMIAAGAGMGILPRYFGDADPRIARCSDPVADTGILLHILTRPEQRKLHRIKTVVDFIHEQLSAMPGFARSA